MNPLQRLKAFSTTEISDALDASNIPGALHRIHSVVSDCQLVGPAYTIRYAPYDEKPATFQGAADYIDTVPAGSVIVIDNAGRDECTVWGDILTHVARKKAIAGTVVHGAIRDVAPIRALRYPLFCCSVTMRSGKNRVYKIDEQCTLMIQNVIIQPGDIIFADDNGVVVIPKNLVDEVIIKATNIQQTEKKIIAAIQAGHDLAQARKMYHYDKPWLK